MLRALPCLPSLKDIAAIVAATALMAALLWPLQGRFAAPLELLVQGSLGVAIYGALILACDVAGWRGMLLQRLRRRA